LEIPAGRDSHIPTTPATRTTQLCPHYGLFSGKGREDAGESDCFQRLVILPQELMKKL